MKTLEMLNKVMTDVGAVGKEGYNETQRFKFRGVDAVVNAVAPALRKHGGIIWPEVIDEQVEQLPSKSGGIMHRVRLQVKYHVSSTDGEPITGVVAAEAFDSGDKATAKAMSVAYRTFLLQLLCLPTDDVDPDAQTYETAKPELKQVDWLAKGKEATTLDGLKLVYNQANAAGVNPDLLEQIKALGANLE